MKRSIAVLALLISATTAHAFDVWVDENVGTNETIYTSGKRATLMVGKRGFAFANLSGIHVNKIENEISLSIDGAESETIVGSNLGTKLLMITDNKTLIARVAKAKKIELQFRACVESICTFSYTDGIKSFVWEFEQSLSDQYPEYQQQINK